MTYRRGTTVTLPAPAFWAPSSEHMMAGRRSLCRSRHQADPRVQYYLIPGEGGDQRLEPSRLPPRL